MTIKNGKIVKASENELYKYWLRRYVDIMSFPDYLDWCKAHGTEITESL